MVSRIGTVGDLEPGTYYVYVFRRVIADSPQIPDRCRRYNNRSLGKRGHGPEFGNHH